MIKVVKNHICKNCEFCNYYLKSFGLKQYVCDYPNVLLLVLNRRINGIDDKKMTRKTSPKWCPLREENKNDQIKNCSNM